MSERAGHSGGRRRGIVALAVGVVSAFAVLAPGVATGSTFSFTSPIITPADPDAEAPLGHMRVIWNDKTFRLSVRGSVRLEAGDWCIRTLARRGKARYPISSSVFTLDQPQVKTIPRFNRVKLPRFSYGDSQSVELVRVIVRRGDCAGPLVATGRLVIGGL